MDLGHVRIRYDDEWQIAKRLNAVGETRREDGEGEVGRGEELLCCERRSSVSKPSRDSDQPEFNEAHT